MQEAQPRSVAGPCEDLLRICGRTQRGKGAAETCDGFMFGKQESLQLLCEQSPRGSRLESGSAAGRSPHSRARQEIVAWTSGGAHRRGREVLF